MGNDTRARFRILGRDDIRAALSMRECIDLMVTTMTAVSEGKADLPLRSVMSIQGTRDLLGVMPGHIAGIDALGLKAICLIPENPSHGLSSHSGVVLMFDKKTGQLRAVLDAAEITEMRTPAATAAASRVLARPDAGDLAVLGTGQQALRHLETMTLVHDLRRIRLWGRNRSRAEALAEKAAAFCPVSVEVMDEAKQAVEGADIICAVTASSEPILRGLWLTPGVHVNLVGAGAVNAAEIDVEGVQRARFFVDYKPSALAQAGELKRAVDANAVTMEHLLGEIGDVHLGRCKGRIGRADITIYKSLGVAAQDLATADAVCAAAQRMELGTVATI